MLIISNNQYLNIAGSIDQNMVSKYKELLQTDFPGFLDETPNFNWDKYLMNCIKYLRSAGFEDIENYYFFMCLSVANEELRNPGIPLWVNDFIKNYSKSETERIELLEEKIRK